MPKPVSFCLTTGQAYRKNRLVAQCGGKIYNVKSVMLNEHHNYKRLVVIVFPLAFFAFLFSIPSFLFSVTFGFLA